MRASTVLAIGVAASVIAWLAAPELHPAGRALTAFLLGIFPAFAVVQAQAVAGLAELPSRNRLYASTIVALWGLAIVTAFCASESGISPRLLGVNALPWPSFVLWFAFSMLAVGALILLFKALGVTETRMIQHMIPQSRTEKALYLGVSATAGICEELVFRGFLVATLTVATGSVPLAVVLSAGTFGIAHAHQHAAGAVRAALLAAVLTVPLLATGSLYPGIAAHAVVDLVAGLWLSKWLLKS
jgi:membrane protease YdiL (CAAX protease family)